MYPLSGSFLQISPHAYKKDEGRHKTKQHLLLVEACGGKKHCGQDSNLTQILLPICLINKCFNHWGQGRKLCPFKSTSWDLVLLGNEKRRKSFIAGEEQKIFWAQIVRELLPLGRGRIIKRAPSLKLKGSAFAKD